MRPGSFLLANSRLGRCLPSLTTFTAHLVVPCSAAVGLVAVLFWSTGSSVPFDSLDSGRHDATLGGNNATLDNR